MDKIATNPQRHILFELSPLDNEADEIETKTQRHYQNLKKLIDNKSPKECHEIYLKQCAANPSFHSEELTLGLLVGILLEPERQSDYYRDVVTFSKDNLNQFSMNLNVIIVERMHKLSPQRVYRLFWVAGQLIKAGHQSAEHTCSNLIRQVAGGDLSSRNIFMVETLLELLIENRSWLVNHPTMFIGPTVVYTLMRLIADHMGPAQSSLKQKEVDFVIGLIKEKFDYVLSIGRDFLRLLNNLIKIPEFEKLHQDIYNNPKVLSPKYEGPQQLLASRTPRRLFQSRLTFDMERKFSFLPTHVKFGNQKRYQDWFHKQYLSTPESLSLRCDLIRYICTIIHPSNEVLCSDIIPRWAIIGWLLTTCTTSASAASSKQALFFDWFAFEAKTDNIMNIEPAILVMYYSLRSHPNVTASLLDYLCRAPSVFGQKLVDNIKCGIRNSLQQILEKRVIQSLAPLFDNPKHDISLRALIKESFPEFCAGGQLDNGVVPLATSQTNSVVASTNTTSEGATTKQGGVALNDIESVNWPNTPNKPSNDTNHVARYPETNSTQASDAEKIKSQGGNCIKIARSESNSPILIDMDGPETPNGPKLNHDKAKVKKTVVQDLMTDDSTRKKSVITIDDDDDGGLIPDVYSSIGSDPSLKLDENSPTKVIYDFMTVKRSVPLDKIKTIFDESTNNILDDLLSERSKETRCKLMDKLISAILDMSESTLKSTNLDDLGCCVAQTLAEDFSTKIFPSTDVDSESLEDSIAMPFFVLCRSAFSKTKANPKLLSLLVSISKAFEATGFLVLYFSRVLCYVSDQIEFAAPYTTFHKAAKRQEEDLLQDLEMSATYDPEMFCFILPSVITELHGPIFTINGNIKLTHLIVSTIDPACLQELIGLSLPGTSRLICRDDPIPLIEASLNWESWEQYCVWKLISASSISPEKYMSIIPKLDCKANPEAISAIMMDLQKVTEPWADLIRCVTDAYSKQNDQFVSAILRFWGIKTDTDKLVDNVVALFDLNLPKRKSSQSKAQGPKRSTLSPSCEKILLSLDAIKKRAPKNKFLNHPDLLESLPHLEQLCNDAQKKRFADLLSMKPKPTKKKKTEKDV